jgi:hypothetical protein
MTKVFSFLYLVFIFISCDNATTALFEPTPKTPIVSSLDVFDENTGAIISLISASLIPPALSLTQIVC